MLAHGAGKALWGKADRRHCAMCCPNLRHHGYWLSGAESKLTKNREQEHAHLPPFPEFVNISLPGMADINC